MDMQLSLSHLGYLPESPKILTLLPGDASALPETIPFYLRQNCLRLPRSVTRGDGFSARFPSPFDLLRGKLVPAEGSVLYQGELRRISSRWGPMWQADFSRFKIPGSYQIETDWQVSPPFAIHDRVYDRIIAGYLTFLRAQRCGYELFGIHAACHLDDGILDTNGSPLPAAGGWHDAGDFRKWLAFTLYHVEALLTLHERLGEDLARGGIAPDSLLDELSWGNAYFHRMIDPSGQVYEDVAGGSAPPGSNFTYENNWWFENHPGCYGDASDNRWTDNVAQSGDERRIRTTYNPLVQWAFVHVQARASRHLRPPQTQRCMRLARQAAAFARQRGHDNRTLFLAAELRGNLELLAAGDVSLDLPALIASAGELLRRQAKATEGLSGYFLEADSSDGFRSIAFAADPALTLLRLWELRAMLPAKGIAEQARQAVIRLYRELPAGRLQQQSLFAYPLRRLSRPARSRPAVVPRCGKWARCADLHSSVQFAGNCPWDKFSPHEPRASVSSRCHRVEPARVARAGGAVAALVPRTQYAQPILVLRNRLPTTHRLFLSYPATP